MDTVSFWGGDVLQSDSDGHTSLLNVLTTKYTLQNSEFHAM